VIASLLISAKLFLKDIREKENAKDGKHDKKFNQNNPPQFPSPGHFPETIHVKPVYPFYHQNELARQITKSSYPHSNIFIFIVSK